MSHQTWHIPANYTDAGKLFGMFAIRNTIEAVLLAGPCIFFCLRLLPFAITTNITITLVAGCREMIEDNINEVRYLAANEAVTRRFFLIFQHETRMKTRAATVKAIAERMRDVGDIRQDYEELDSAISSGLYLKESINRSGEDFYSLFAQE